MSHTDAFAQSSRLQPDQKPVSDVTVREVNFMRRNDRMEVDMKVDLRDMDVRSNRAVLLTPSIVNDRDTLPLYSVGIYGRRRYFYYVRNSDTMIAGPTEQTYRTKDMPSELTYSTEVPYADWMNGSQLWVTRQEYGCCSAVVDEECGPLCGYKIVTYKPEFHYVTPIAEVVKSRALSGRAFIDFPVNRTELYPDYRGNRAELAKIIATIDSVRADRDVTVTALSIKGFASPEGSYENNIRLARGRTETLKRYVQRLYHFEPDFISTDYEPEDWAGLREYVAGSSLPSKYELLAIIDDPTLEPDPKDWRMRLRHTEDYMFLLEHVYPGLRHSDYEISYTIRGYGTPEEIREIMAVSPQKLSLNEMYILAQTLEPGSDEYNDVFETAVRMFPDDAAANLNAANAAMGRGDYVLASRYLSKAGDGPEVTYARGVLSALRGEYVEALRLVRESLDRGMKDVGGVAAHLEEVIKYSPEIVETH